MAFSDDPIIDKNAERSQESVLKTKLLFSKKNGFISHEVNGSEDYGVDVICQMIENGKATSFYFPIQIKSKKSYKETTRQNTLFKKFSFSTSRLGHLIRHTPLTGLIVIFDERTEELFFECALTLYNDIRESHTDDTWKQQETVTLYINSKNVLDEDKIRQVYVVSLSHFYRSNQLLIDHSANYDLQVSEEVLKSTSTKDFLLEYGESLFRSSDYNSLCAALERLPRSAFQDFQICYLAAITYVDVGNLVDSDYYFRLSDKHINEYTSDQREMINIQRFRLEYYMGRKSREELKSMLKSFEASASTTNQLLSLKINLLGLDLSDFIPDEDYDEEFLNSLESIFKEIDESDQSESSKQYQLVYVADLLVKAVNGVLTSMFLNTKISQTIGTNPVTPDRMKKSERIQTLNAKGLKYLQNALKFAEENKDQIMEASARYHLSLAYFGQLRSYHSANIMRPFSFTDKFLEELYRGAIMAYNTFNKKRMRPLAYKAILLAKEIYTLAELWANFSLEHIAKKVQVDKVLNEFNDSDFKKFNGSLVERTEKFIKNVKRVFGEGM